MSGNGSISGGTSEVLAILVGNVLTVTVFVALGKTEIDDVNVVASSVRSTDQEVIRLDITMDDALFVHLLDTADELDGNHQHRLEVEVALARLEEIFERRSKEIHDHHVELHVGDRGVRTDVVKARHASCRKNESY